MTCSIVPPGGSLPGSECQCGLFFTHYTRFGCLVCLLARTSCCTATEGHALFKRKSSIDISDFEQLSRLHKRTTTPIIRN